MRVLDTDTSVEILRGNLVVIDRRLQIDDVIVTTWITASELMYGAAKSRAPAKNRVVVAEFLAVVPILNITADVAERFGELKANLERQGERLDDFDLLISATAIVYEAVLVTGSARHYERVDGLRMEDWIRG